MKGNLMQGKKRILVLLGLPLGASGLLLPGSPAQAAETAVSAAPSATCSTVADAPPNPFGSVAGSGFNAGEPVRFSADGQVIRDDRFATAGGTVGISGVNLSARNYTLLGKTSGAVASCAGMTPPVTAPGGDTEPGGGGTGTPAALRAAGYSDGRADGLDTCTSGRPVSRALDLQQGARTEEYFAGYTQGKNDAQNLSACLNKATAQPGDRGGGGGGGGRGGGGDRRGNNR